MGTPLTDDDRMTWSRKYMGRRLGEVPDHFWLWFLEQDWCDKYPDYVEYAKCVED
jgi:hypothetical protein